MPVRVIGERPYHWLHHEYDQTGPERSDFAYVDQGFLATITSCIRANLGVFDRGSGITFIVRTDPRLILSG